MSSNETVIEEISSLEMIVRSITSLEAGTVLLLVYWLIIAFLRWESAISEDTFMQLFIFSGILTNLFELMKNKER